jgi:3-oxoacyl-[acyl-carrier-protein] synthase I
MNNPIAIVGTGLVASVGLTAASACAAIRAKISNPTETRFMGSGAEWILAHQVPVGDGQRGKSRLARMASMAIDECMTDVPRDLWPEIPLLLCVAERDRPGRTNGVEEPLFEEIQQQLRPGFCESKSLIVPQGRVSLAFAMQRARTMLAEAPRVLVAAVDSLITRPTLEFYDREGRLLAANNSNGFMPGEGAGAILLARPDGNRRLCCTGVGMSTETSHIESGLPLRGEGLASAIRGALAEAGRAMHDMDYRITDVSGEHYYFKESSLALSRLMRARKEHFDFWHPAECIGETGALAGMATVIVADSACIKGYSRGENIICHAANDDGQRAAAIMQFGTCA